MSGLSSSFVNIFASLPISEQRAVLLDLNNQVEPVALPNKKDNYIPSVSSIKSILIKEHNASIKKKPRK